MLPFNVSKELFIVDNPNMVRLDKFLASKYPEYSRAYFQELIEKESALINGKPSKKRYVPNLGDQVEVHFKQRPGPNLCPQAIPLDILYEDTHLIAVNKPADMVVHPAPGNWSHTFVNALLNHCSLSTISDEFRPGIVHRLDKETSGVILAAKTDLAHQKLSEQFANRTIQKEYQALVYGKVVQGQISAPIRRCPINRKKMSICFEGGKEAYTDVELIAFNGLFSKVKIKPKTGRTHQIRVHLQYQKTPILGDKLYGNMQINQKYNFKRHYLHAKKISFNHPLSSEKLTIEAPVPKEMDSIFICGF